MIFIPQYKTKMYTPRMRHLKVNMTYLCDLRCPNCNRATQHCPSSAQDNVSLLTWSNMLEECGRQGKIWTRITLTGGEPTLHPEFNGFVDAMAAYKHKYNPDCIITTYTYHHPKFFYKIEKALADHPYLDVKDTSKDKPKIHKIATYMAPIDDPKYGPNHFYKGCQSGHLCGLGFDNSGFYFCSVAAGIARIFGLQHLAIKNIEDCSRDNLLAQYQPLCSKCGFYHNPRPVGDEEPMSPAWVKAIEDFKAKKNAEGR